MMASNQTEQRRGNGRDWQPGPWHSSGPAVFSPIVLTFSLDTSYNTMNISEYLLRDYFLRFGTGSKTPAQNWES